MRHCIKCEFSKKEYDTSRGQAQGFLLCEHSECSDPVEGHPLPCIAARQQSVFCGFEARFYKPKQDVTPGSVLTLTQPVSAPVIIQP